MIRLGEAQKAREQIHLLIRARGKWAETNVGPVLTAEFGRFLFLYQTPFQREMMTKKAGPGACAPVKIRPLTYELNAWHSRRKVLAMEWEEGKTPRLLVFRRGPWMGELTSIVSEIWSKGR